ncbi:MAG TPA: quinone-dependent dihydroorotate dehydrogenase [Saprospiraceae bacterium]|nr:quinone-dependent dihydroorotate dehydrogenase [Saprospiraceae bacterium]
MLYRILKKVLFQLEPEKAHRLAVSFFTFSLRIPILSKLIRSNYRNESPQLKREYFGLKFNNPIGLAAGFDKDGKYYETMSALGFGFIEIGTVTPVAQQGNPKPRLFRLPKDESLINRMGFNNDGVDAMVERLKNRKNNDIIIGGNIGKNKQTPNDQAIQDYLICFEKLFDYVDYFVVNVSSPNTPGLRDLQDKKPLTEILQTLQLNNQKKSEPKPIFLKIAPDLTDSQLDDIVEIIESTKIAGVIATNTTIDRHGLKTQEEIVSNIGNGGLSGKAIQEKSTDIIRKLHNKSKGNLFIIGVGGINSPDEARKKLNAGASLVQVYSGLIYEGPSLVKNIKKALSNQI